MGKFLTCIITKKKEVLFCEWMDYEAIKGRIELPDDRFVGVENTVTWGYVIEEDPIPRWYRDIHSEMRQEVKELERTIWPIRKEFMKSEDPASVVHSKEYDVAYGAFLNSRGAAMARYANEGKGTREEYKIAIAHLTKEFTQVQERIDVDYDLAIIPALRIYIEKLSKIEGYVPLRGSGSNAEE